uniref:Tyr recombinase domain-containing protein n=1 Tax=Solibacter usitatus (strain Ellin6076) TaxID=234267 RepID=Q01RG5_SOLUE
MLLRGSKTDPEGAERRVGIPYGSDISTCPVRTYRRWLEVLGIAAGPVFRSTDHHGRIGRGAITPQMVALVVNRSCEAAGLDPLRFSTHSLRSGLATQAARNGASECAIIATDWPQISTNGEALYSSRRALHRRLGLWSCGGAPL